MKKHSESVITRGDPQKPQGPENAKERFYEKLRIPIRTLDIIIGGLIAVLVLVLVLGYLKGHS